MRKFLMGAAFLAAGFQIFAQAQAKNNAETEEEIELPDVTTVVNGKTFTVGKDSVPDYTEILPERDAPAVRLPRMEDAGAAQTPAAKNRLGGEKSKDIYAEGELGAGYPFYFKGDFSIYRASGNSPFEIDFKHESAEGFAGRKANEGYFSRSTAVSGEKSVSGTLGTHRGFAEYKMSDDGLQLKSNACSDMVKHTISGSLCSDWELGGGILVSYGADAAWFSRYGEIQDGTIPGGGYEETTKIADVNPYLGFGWCSGFFKAMLTSLYGFQGNLEKSGNLLEIEHSSNKNASHRGQLKLALEWENDSVTAGADGSLIIGTATGRRDILPAFTGLFDFRTAAFTGERPVVFSARGGLDSYQEKIRNLENLYRFAVCAAIPTETTDWFSSLRVTVPVRQAFEFKSGFEFRKTAFGNYAWQADYTARLPANGLYKLMPAERTEFNTDAGFSADFSPVKAGIGWQAYWRDVPSLKDRHNIRASVEYQDSGARMNAGASAGFALGGGADKCPDISLWAGIRLAPALSLALEVNDVIKLFGSASRDYAHSGYITTSGNAVLLAKFQF